MHSESKNRAACEAQTAMTPATDLSWLQDLPTPPALDPAELAKREQHERAGKARELFERLPEFLRRGQLLTEERIPDEQFRKFAHRWVPAHRNVLVLGETGLGKTTAVGAICRRLIADGVNQGEQLWKLAQGIRWYRAKELERQVRAHPLGRGEAPALVNARHARLLVIDDAGWEKDPSLVSDLLADRYESRGLTLVTSGREYSELHGLYSEAVMRRMFQVDGNKQRLLVSRFPKAEAKREAERAEKRRNGTPEPAHTETN